MDIYITRDGQEYGPYTLEDVSAHLINGDLNENDLAWHEGLKAWTPLRVLIGRAQKSRVPIPQRRMPMPATSQSNLQTAQAESPPGFKSLLTVGGVLCYVFAVVDFAGMFFGYDITGVSWSPIVAGFIGSALINCGQDK